MRIGTLFLALLLVPAALAQPCDPAQTDEACADTTTWQRYFPLDVGNQWQYRDAFYDEPITHWSWTVTGQTEVAGQSYFELERCDEAADGSATCADPLLLRYDDAHELIARRTDGGEVWWDVLPCGLGAAFNTGAYFDEFEECTGPAAGFAPVALDGAYGATVAVPPDEVTGDTRKRFELYPGTGPELYAGLGVTEFYYDLQEIPTRLVYANVGGEEIGTPAFASCDPADSDVACPDTTDWRRYLPLEVGNAWQYRYTSGGPSFSFGYEVVGEEEIDGVLHYLVRYCRRWEGAETTCFDPSAVRYGGGTVLLRYDESNGGSEDEVSYGPWLSEVFCPLGASFQEGAMLGCSDYSVSGSVTGAYGVGYTLGGQVVGDTRKTFDDGMQVQGRGAFVAGVGLVREVDVDGQTTFELAYARLGGAPYGTPIFVFPTPNEPGAAQPVATAFTDVFPNPARGTLRAQYALGAPQVVTLELIDLLGRRVRSVEVGPQPAGTHDVRLDLGGLRAGLYVLRLRGDAGGEATRQIVVVR